MWIYSTRQFCLSVLQHTQVRSRCRVRFRFPRNQKQTNQQTNKQCFFCYQTTPHSCDLFHLRIQRTTTTTTTTLVLLLVVDSRRFWKLLVPSLVLLVDGDLVFFNSFTGVGIQIEFRRIAGVLCGGDDGLHGSAADLQARPHESHFPRRFNGGFCLGIQTSA